MKKYIFFYLMIFAFAYSDAQITLNSGANLVVESNTVLVANDGITSNSGTISNDGTIINHGDLINNTSAFFTPGSTGTFIFEGTSMQKITGDHDVEFYGTLKIDNAAGLEISDISTGAHQTVNGLLILEDGMIVLNDFDLYIGGSDPQGINDSRYIQTNSDGMVYRSIPSDGITFVLFPVGNSDYNPISLQGNLSSTADDYGVKVMDHEPANTASPNIVNRSWEVSETTPGGTKLQVKLQWDGSQESPGFNRVNSAVGLTTDNGANYVWMDRGPAAGSDPYTKSGSPFFETGVFTVADYYFTVPENLDIASTTIDNYESDCFDARQVITVAGDGTIVEVLSGGNAKFVAGGTIYLKYGFSSKNGSYTHAYITTNDEFCWIQAPDLVAYQEDVVEETVGYEDNFFEEEGPSVNIYPNPTAGRFNLDFYNLNEKFDIHVMNFQGQEVFTASGDNQLSMEMDISHQPAGIYLIIIKTNNHTITKKVIKN